MIETSITREEYLQDLENTRREADAYKKIADGFMELSKLPENAGGNSSRLRHESNGYMARYNQCVEFLTGLEAIGDRF